jgi:integrase
MDFFTLNKMRIRFWTRIDATNLAGEAPLNCYVILNKVKSSDFSVDLMIPLAYWDSKKQQVNDSHPLANALNQKITFIKVRLMQIEMQLSLQGEVTAKMIKDKFFQEYKTKRPEPKALVQKKEPETLKYLFSEQMTQYFVKVRIPMGISRNTKKNENTFMKNITKFLEKSGLKEIEVKDIDLQFTKQFNLHVKTIKPTTQQVHINRHIAYMRSVLEFCLQEKQIQFNPLASLKLSCEYEGNPDSFELDDIIKLKEIPSHFLTIEQNQVRDILLFMIGSGMDHCDYIRRKDSWLYRDDDRYWVKYTRQKTMTYLCPKGKKADSLLLPDAVEIFLKYEGSLLLMPNCTLNVMNDEIKQIYKIAKIRRPDLEKISSKLARKTYANLYSNYMNLSDESLAYMMGHTTTKHLKKYRKFHKRRVMNELKKK